MRASQSRTAAVTSVGGCTQRSTCARRSSEVYEARTSSAARHRLHSVTVSTLLTVCPAVVSAQRRCTVLISGLLRSVSGQMDGLQ